MRAAIAALAAALLLFGCGGNDKSDARKTVREFVQAVNARDADKFCDDLVTKAFVEEYTGATGGAARAQCKTQVRTVKGLHVQLISVGRTDVHGDTATVSSEIATQGERHPQVFHLKKEGGRWRLSSGTAG
jgi:ketosteroid isomerase-like protein